MTPVYLPKNPHEKAMQRALIQYRNPANYDLVKEALQKAGRTDLIGFDQKCLIRPRKLSGEKAQKKELEAKKKHSGRKNPEIKRKKQEIKRKNPEIKRRNPEIKREYQEGRRERKRSGKR